MNTIIIWCLAAIGVVYCLKWLWRRRKHAWSCEIYGDLAIVSLGNHWLRLPSDNGSKIEFKNQRTGATMHLIPGPKQDARAAIETATLLQMITGIKADKYTVPTRFIGRSGNGYFREQLLESFAMSIAVLETPSTTFHLFTTDPQGSRKTGAEALQALKDLLIFQKHA